MGKQRIWGKFLKVLGGEGGRGQPLPRLGIRVAAAQLLSAVSDWMREMTLCYQLPEEWFKTLKDIKAMMALW